MDAGDWKSGLEAAQKYAATVARKRELAELEQAVIIAAEMLVSVNRHGTTATGYAAAYEQLAASVAALLQARGDK